MDIGVVNPGQMGAAVAAQAVGAGHRVYWLPAGRGRATAARAAEAGLVPAADLASMAASCAVILSICPPAAATDVAEQVAAASFRGIYVEANAISPERTLRIAELFGDRAVDGGIVGPPPHRPGTSRLYLSGPGTAARTVAALFTGTALAARVLDGPVGRASALKLAFASYNKISIALAAQAAALAAAHGVLEELEELGATQLPGTPLGRLETLPGAAARAWRWAPEMAEIAAACTAAGLAPELALAAERLLGRWAVHKDDDGIPLGDLLDQLAER